MSSQRCLVMRPFFLLLSLLVQSASALLVSHKCASTLADGGVHRQRQFASPALVRALRHDLGAMSFVPTASFSSNGEQDDLRAAFTCRPDMDSPTFNVLYEQLDGVRSECEAMIGRPLSTGMEATFVVYPEGGYYKRHVDSIEGIDVAGSGRRAISFICYLLDEDGEPWTRRDGGELRVWNAQPVDSQHELGHAFQTLGQHEDVLPESGMLVLFDSKRVWHEVRPTNRERACLVGWFREA